MALETFEGGPPGTGDPLSTGGSFTNPLEVTCPSGTTTSAIPLVLGTFDEAFYYTMEGSQGVTPVDIDGSDESDWMYLSDDGVSFGAAGAGLTNLGTIGPGDAIYIEFWVKFAVPAGEDAQQKTDLRLRRNYTKHAVAS